MCLKFPEIVERFYMHVMYKKWVSKIKKALINFLLCDFNSYSQYTLNCTILNPLSYLNHLLYGHIL